jgi:uncharacterized membrane protein YccC
VGLSSLSIRLRPALPSARSVWRRESSAVKQGVKTGLAGAITYAIYAGWHLHQGYWAVFSALLVTQANVGASWRAALYRTIGSTSGAIAAALLLPLMGRGAAQAAIAIFILASFFSYLTALHPSFMAAGFTAALILVFGGIEEPWHVAWLRVAYTALGALIAFAVSALVWPVQARLSLRNKLATILQGAGALYSSVVDAALRGTENQQEVQTLDRELHNLRRGITQQMQEARGELRFTHFNESAFQAFVDQSDQIRRRLTAMAEDSGIYADARVPPGFVPSISVLAACSFEAFSELSKKLRARDRELRSSEKLQRAVRALDSDLSQLRERRATAPFTLDRMLPFWSFVFNVREVAEDLQRLGSLLGEL